MSAFGFGCFWHSMAFHGIPAGSCQRDPVQCKVADASLHCFDGCSTENMSRLEGRICHLREKPQTRSILNFSFLGLGFLTSCKGSASGAKNVRTRFHLNHFEPFGKGFKLVFGRVKGFEPIFPMRSGCFLDCASLSEALQTAQGTTPTIFSLVAWQVTAWCWEVRFTPSPSAPSASSQVKKTPPTCLPIRCVQVIPPDPQMKMHVLQMHQAGAPGWNKWWGAKVYKHVLQFDTPSTSTVVRARSVPQTVPLLTGQQIFDPHGPDSGRNHLFEPSSLIDFTCME